MKPAICSVSGKPPASKSDGDWVKFKDYDEGSVTQLSHPVGLEFFSGEYVEEARKLSHMNSIDAVNKMKTMYLRDSVSQVDHIYESKWWKRWLRL